METNDTVAKTAFESALVLAVGAYTMFENPEVGAKITIPEIREILTSPGTQILYNCRVYTCALSLTAAMNFDNAGVGIKTASSYATFIENYEAKEYLEDLLTDSDHPPFVYIGANSRLFLIDVYALYFIRWGCPTLSTSLDISNFLVYQVPIVPKLSEIQFKKDEFLSTFLETPKKIVDAMSPLLDNLTQLEQQEMRESRQKAAEIFSKQFICVKKTGFYNQNGELVNGGGLLEQLIAGSADSHHAFLKVIAHD